MKFCGNGFTTAFAGIFPWRPHVGDTLQRFLDCGVLANGFLRVRCANCHHEVLVPWSCKRVSFCPSCAQRRALEFGDFVDGEVLEQVPYRHIVWTIPRMLRPIFLRERTLLRKLSACAWKSVLQGLRTALGESTAVPGAVLALATAGDLLNAHCHIHGLVSAGAWVGFGVQARFLPWPEALTQERLEDLFRRLVLRMLVRRERLAESTADRLLEWRHSGFNIFLGLPVEPWETASRRRIARYILKSPLSLERLHYDETSCRVTYGSKKRGHERSMSALDFLAELTVHVLSRGQHQALYYGRCSNRSRGMRCHEQQATEPPLDRGETEDSDIDCNPTFTQRRRAFRLRWATLLQRVWGVDVMACPRCASRMTVVAGISDLHVVERILRHLGLFDQPRAPNVHDCPSPPALVDGQTLLMFAPRPGRTPPSSSTQTWTELPAPTECPTEPADPRLNDEWPVDPPFDDD